MLNFTLPRNIYPGNIGSVVPLLRDIANRRYSVTVNDNDDYDDYDDVIIPFPIADTI
jgi:hypothetical protein